MLSRCLCIFAASHTSLHPFPTLHHARHPALCGRISSVSDRASLQVLTAKRIGVVAHFYMDPQVQGVLTAAGEHWPHIHISDSLVMADAAVRMAEAGCTAVAVLGVDFMSENVRAILDEAGHTGVKVCCALGVWEGLLRGQS